MRLAISNLAWDVAEDAAVAALLADASIDAIDIAPSRYFPQPSAATGDDVARVRDWWAERGVAITGLQALLFGTSGLNLFGPADVQAAMLAHLGSICRIGRGLGARRLVFGSPRSRDRGALDDATTLKAAVAFFTQLGDLAATEGVVVCLEPNPPRYGANFMTTTAETAAVVTAVAHPAIALQLDTGALTLNGEDPEGAIARFAGLIGHVHASEPNLVPIGDGGTMHARIGQTLARHRPDAVVCIEMVATTDEPHLEAIARAVGVTAAAYRAV